jgi:hypothetical protein
MKARVAPSLRVMNAGFRVRFGLLWVAMKSEYCHQTAVRGADEEVGSAAGSAVAGRPYPVTALEF